MVKTTRARNRPPPDRAVPRRPRTLCRAGRREARSYRSPSTRTCPPLSPAHDRRGLGEAKTRRTPCPLTVERSTRRRDPSSESLRSRGRRGHRRPTDASSRSLSSRSLPAVRPGTGPAGGRGQKNPSHPEDRAKTVSLTSGRRTGPTRSGSLREQRLERRLDPRRAAVRRSCSIPLARRPQRPHLLDRRVSDPRVGRRGDRRDEDRGQTRPRRESAVSLIQAPAEPRGGDRVQDGRIRRRRRDAQDGRRRQARVGADPRRPPVRRCARARRPWPRGGTWASRSPSSGTRRLPARSMPPQWRLASSLRNTPPPDVEA